MSEPNHQDLEKRSSAYTLSDMEIFIFPELMYSLVLANIMSPRLWEWRQDPWFEGMAKMTPYRRITRLKQFIMDYYTFNLDLGTWGLTTQERELARFQDFIDPDTLAKSNALFGYQGDKYYFDSGIRQHFHRYLSGFDFRYNAGDVSDAERALLAVSQSGGKRPMYRDSCARKTD